MTNTDTSEATAAAEADTAERAPSSSDRSRREPSKGVPVAERSPAKTSKSVASAARASAGRVPEPRPAGRRTAAKKRKGGEGRSNGGNGPSTRSRLPTTGRTATTERKLTDANRDYAQSPAAVSTSADTTKETAAKERALKEPAAKQRAGTKPAADNGNEVTGKQRADAKPTADTKPAADTGKEPASKQRADAKPTAGTKPADTANEAVATPNTEPAKGAESERVASVVDLESYLDPDAATSEPSRDDVHDEEQPGWARRHVVFVAVVASSLVIAAGGALGFFFAESRPDIWQAESEIVLQSPASQVDRYLGTQVVTAMSSSVVRRAAAELPVDQAYIDEKLSVGPIDAGVALRVSFDDEDPDLALDIVDAVVSAYLTEAQTESTNTTRAVYSTRIEELRSARALIEADLADVESANAAAEALELVPPNPTEERRLSLESSQLLEQIAGLESQLLVTDIEILNEDQATVVTPAQMVPERVAPSPITFAALGMLVGGVVAATVVFLLGLFRTGSRPERR